MSPRLVIAVAVAASSFVLACTKDEAAGAAAAGSAAPSTSAAVATSASAKVVVSPADFCAFMERLLIAQMVKRDTDHAVSKERMQKEAKQLNDGCEAAIAKLAAKDPDAWQACAQCLTSKSDFASLDVCNQTCSKVGFGPRPTSSASASAASVPAASTAAASGSAAASAGR